MFIWFRKHIPASLALLAIVGYFSIVLIDLNEQQASIKWCENEICLSQEWIDVANRVMDNKRYNGMLAPTKTMNLFRIDLGSLQHQSSAVYKFLVFTLNKDARFIDIALAMLLDGQNAKNIEHQNLLKNAISAYWREQPNEGCWYENITGTNPKDSRPPKHLIQLLNHGIPSSEHQESDILRE